MKVDQEVDRKVTGESQSFERSASGVERTMGSTSMRTAASSSHVSSIVRTGKSDCEELPKEMHEMKITDEKTDTHDDTVLFQC